MSRKNAQTCNVQSPYPQQFGFWKDDSSEHEIAQIVDQACESTLNNYYHIYLPFYDPTFLGYISTYTKRMVTRLGRLMS